MFLLWNEGSFVEAFGFITMCCEQRLTLRQYSVDYHCFAVHCCVGKLHALQNGQNTGFIDQTRAKCEDGTEITHVQMNRFYVLYLQLRSLFW